MVDANSGLLGSLDRLDEQATENDDLAIIATALRKMCSTLKEMKDQMEAKVKNYYTVDEIAAMTGRAPYTVRTWIRAGKLSAERIEGTGPKGRLLVPRAELEKLIRSGVGEGISGMIAP